MINSTLHAEVSGETYTDLVEAAEEEIAALMVDADEDEVPHKIVYELMIRKNESGPAYGATVIARIR